MKSILTAIAVATLSLPSLASASVLQFDIEGIELARTSAPGAGPDSIIFSVSFLLDTAFLPVLTGDEIEEASQNGQIEDIAFEFPVNLLSSSIDLDSPFSVTGFESGTHPGGVFGGRSNGTTGTGSQGNDFSFVIEDLTGTPELGQISVSLGQPGTSLGFFSGVDFTTGSFSVLNTGTGIRTTTEFGPGSEIPIPGALPLFAAGLAGFGWLRRRRT